MSVQITNVFKFETDLRKFAIQLEQTADVVVRKIAFDMFAGIVERTPVDTGWAQGSWNVSLDVRDASIPKRPNTTSDAKARNVEQSAKLRKRGEPITKVFITNALPYIIPLENGHSKQAGKGHMVQRTFAEVTGNLQATLRQIR